MEEFYKQTGGVTLLVIRHNGTSFNYANGTNNMGYSNKWKFILPLMQVGKFYVIPCIVSENKYKASLQPFGVAFELDSEKEARQLSYNHVSDVKNGKWDANKEFKQLVVDCANYQSKFFNVITTNLLTMILKRETTK